MISKGDVIEVVLDVVHVTRDGREFERVLVRGVFPRGVITPDPAPGATRNVVQVFFDIPISPSPIGAFLIETAIAQDQA
jgi:hypothetical protein